MKKISVMAILVTVLFLTASTKVTHAAAPAWAYIACLSDTTYYISTSVRWADASGATSYDINRQKWDAASASWQLSRDFSDITGTAQSDTISDSAASPTGGDGDYRYRVRAKVGGVWSGWRYTRNCTSASPCGSNTTGKAQVNLDNTANNSCQ